MSSKNFKKNKKNEKILLIIFILLIILVFILSLLVYQKKKESKEKIVANILIPIVIEKKDRNISLNVTNLINQDEYILKITNYRGENINKNEIPYTITITNDSKAYISVRKDKEKQNLMVDQEATIITDLKLQKEKKQEVYYFIKVTGKNAKKSDKINITVSS